MRWLMTLVSLLAIVNVLRAPVLCVGSDGHVAVEPAGHEHCAHAGHRRCVEDERARPGFHFHVEEAPCHFCTDIPLSIGALEPSVESSDMTTDVLMAACISSPATADGAAITLSLWQSYTLPPTHFTALRSVILQI